MLHVSHPCLRSRLGPWPVYVSFVHPAAVETFWFELVFAFSMPPRECVVLSFWTVFVVFCVFAFCYPLLSPIKTPFWLLLPWSAFGSSDCYLTVGLFGLNATLRPMHSRSRPQHLWTCYLIITAFFSLHWLNSSFSFDFFSDRNSKFS